MTDSNPDNLTTSQLLLSISANFRRICHYLLTNPKSPMIANFQKDTAVYMESLKKKKVSEKLNKTVAGLYVVEKQLLNSISSPEDYLTWSSILRSRSSL